MTAVIETGDLTKRFGEFTAVDSLSIAVEPGAIFAFLGANGSGKSTTIRMLIGVLRPTSGTIMCLRRTPSKRAGRRVIAPRERSLRASVFSSTRTQPSVSKARVNISSLVSTLTPVRHADGLNQVQPISTTRSKRRTPR